MGFTMASSSFCLASYSSFSAIWFASSHDVVSSIFALTDDLSSSESLDASFSSDIVLFME